MNKLNAKVICLEQNYQDIKIYGINFEGTKKLIINNIIFVIKINFLFSI